MLEILAAPLTSGSIFQEPFLGREKIFRPPPSASFNSFAPLNKDCQTVLNIFTIIVFKWVIINFQILPPRPTIFSESPPFRCLKKFLKPLHLNIFTSSLVILNELSLRYTKNTQENNRNKEKEKPSPLETQTLFLPS